MTRTRLLFATLALTVACTDDKSGQDTSTDDSGETAETATRGLPEGTTTWEGDLSMSTYGFIFDLSIDNSGGDLQAVATVMDDPDAPVGIGTATFSLTGTHDPVSGRVALAPDAWIVESSVALELVGLTATYDPDTSTLSGMIQDYASGSDNALAGGPATATLVTGDGAPTAAGDGAKAIPAGEHSFTGTMQCTGDPRDVAGTLSYDGDGGVEGTIIVGDPGVDTPRGTLNVTGVHNPSTGGLTLVPGTWQEPSENAPLGFFVEGDFDPSTSTFTGGLRTNVNACPDSTWSAVLE